MVIQSNKVEKLKLSYPFSATQRGKQWKIWNIIIHSTMTTLFRLPNAYQPYTQLKGIHNEKAVNLIDNR